MNVLQFSGWLGLVKLFVEAELDPSHLFSFIMLYNRYLIKGCLLCSIGVATRLEMV